MPQVQIGNRLPASCRPSTICTRRSTMIAWSLRQSGSVRAKMCEDVPPYLMGERAGSYYVIDGLRFLVTQEAVLGHVQSLSALPVCGPMPSSDRCACNQRGRMERHVGRSRRIHSVLRQSPNQDVLTISQLDCLIMGLNHHHGVARPAPCTKITLPIHGRII
jgi:hypothetical protein